MPCTAEMVVERFYSCGMKERWVDLNVVYLPPIDFYHEEQKLGWAGVAELG